MKTTDPATATPVSELVWRSTPGPDVPPPPVLVLAASLARHIEQQGSAAYPNECCGALIGRDVKVGGVTRRIVDRLEPLTNSFKTDEQYHRFSLNPLDLLKAEKAAAAEGKLVLGCYHSHPDHPACPSETDREHAWEFYSYAIVAIHKGVAVDMSSWLLDEQRVFIREDIEEIEG